MVVVKVLLLCILAHIIDDFVLQPVCLSNLKQKSWWEENVINHPITKQPDVLKSIIYGGDYKMALFVHALSWAIMIHLPILFLINFKPFAVLVSVMVNCVLHYIVDDLKANRHKINLVEDQLAHFLQVGVTVFSLIFVF